MTAYSKMPGDAVIDPDAFQRRAKIWFSETILLSASQYDMILIVLAIILSVALFFPDRSTNARFFLASLPYKRWEIYWSKWLFGVGSIASVFLAFYLVLTTFYYMSISVIHEPYSVVIQYCLINMLQLIVWFTAGMAIQSIVGNSVLAGFLTPCLSVFWLAIPGVFGILNYKELRYDTQQSNYLYGSLFNIFGANSPKKPWNIDDNSLLYSFANYDSVYYNYYSLKIYILLLATCLFLFLGIMLFIRGKLEQVWGVYISAYVQIGILIATVLSSFSITHIFVRTIDLRGVQTGFSIFDILAYLPYVTPVITFILVKKWLRYIEN